MSKTKLSHSLLSISSDYKLWRSHLNILYLSTKHNNGGLHEDKSNLNKKILLLLGIWPPKKYAFSIPEHLFGLLHNAYIQYKFYLKLMLSYLGTL
jgi:hypothetical protein